ncbi:hypothetical protein HPB49_019978 [Dermacentor silvarum]|uniref:Uncharacterized protein n=1 Tax=Dermacentor silvarum TaxID=543639 RepID=A0ACB8C544_DERSI|nr:hypothetical protein HPB49_019978 [Dermacentor silvarum]
MGSSSGIWVFGYGSLVWNPGFDFVRSQIGYIRGYDRRFWQGNDKHRGTPEKTDEAKKMKIHDGAALRARVALNKSPVVIGEEKSGLGVGASRFGVIQWR